MMPYMSDVVICFDLDDTLYKEIDFVKSAYREIAEKTGHPEAVQSMIKWYYEGKNVFAEMITEYKLEQTLSDCIEIYRNHFPKISLEPEVKCFLDELKSAGVYLGLITNGRSVSQRNKINALGLEGFFDIEVISEEFGYEKPDERCYGVIMETFPECKRYIYIGDNPEKDFIAPNKLGWQTICLLDDGRNIHHQNFNLRKEFLPEIKIDSINAIIDKVDNCKRNSKR